MKSIDARKFLIKANLIFWFGLFIYFSLGFINAFGCKYHLAGVSSRETNIFITCNHSRVTLVTEDKQGSVWQIKGIQFSLLDQLVYIFTSREQIFDMKSGHSDSDVIHVLLDDGLPKHFWVTRWNKDTVVLMRNYPQSTAIELNIDGYLSFEDRIATEM